jgi:hypothetical protein
VASLITLPDASSSLTTPLSTEGYSSAGAVHGQVWIYPVSASGVLRVHTDAPAPGGSSFDIDLAKLTPSQWNRVWITGLSAAAADLTAPGSVSLVNATSGGAPIQFYAWGLVLTQIGKGADLSAVDPGLAMYDGSYKVNDWLGLIDVLSFPAITDSTASTGYCLTATVEPPAGWPWGTAFASDRHIMKWSNTTQQAQLHSVTNTSGHPVIRFFVTGVDQEPEVDLRTDVTTSGPHVFSGCVAPGGAVSLAVDHAVVASTTGGQAIDLAGGQVNVGGDPVGDGLLAPWDGYVSQAAVCFGTSCQ